MLRVCTTWDYHDELVEHLQPAALMTILTHERTTTNTIGVQACIHDSRGISLVPIMTAMHVNIHESHRCVLPDMTCNSGTRLSVCTGMLFINELGVTNHCACRRECSLMINSST